MAMNKILFWFKTHFRHKRQHNSIFGMKIKLVQKKK